MQSMTKMIGEKCQTQTGSSTRPQPDWPEQTLPEMVNQPRMKSRQAPMTSFTIKQILEEQRTFINSHASQAKKLREKANAQKDMSSSSQFSSWLPPPFHPSFLVALSGCSRWLESSWMFALLGFLGFSPALLLNFWSV